ncbi:MAG: flagellar basal body-associated FliL family protein [Deltaproteobacteria bacterium]|nr:flagellar basal body-associated FliL family protein [Deltaproteobacteria bacterium]
MKQKAQIDILDLPLMEGDEVPTDITVDSEKPPPLREVKNKTRKKLYWIAPLAIITIITVVIAGYFIWFQKSEKKTMLPVVATGTPGQKSFMAVIDDFNVDVKDDKGNKRLLSCGFILEMAPHEDGKTLEARLEIRKLIFDTLHKRTVSDLIRNDEKKEIKKEITDGVNRLLGAEKVKETYITKYLLL